MLHFLKLMAVAIVFLLALWVAGRLVASESLEDQAERHTTTGQPK